MAKQHLLAQAISSAAPPEPKSSARRARHDSQLPEPLLDLLLLLPPLLTSADQLPSESIALLLSNPPFSSLDSLLPDLASLVSSNLQSSAVQLARAANPTTNASFLHRHIPSVPGHINSLTSGIEEQSASLTAARLATTDSLLELLDKHTEALSLLIRSLEAKHGGIARSLELRGADAALAARRGEVDAEAALWTVRKDVYTPEVREALRNYVAHVRDGQRRLKEAAKTSEVELAEYGVRPHGHESDDGSALKEKRFREIARAYREVRRQIDDTGRDLNRLR